MPQPFRTLERTVKTLTRFCLALLLALPLAGVSRAESPAGKAWLRQVKAAAKAQEKGDLPAAEKLLLSALLVAEDFGERDPRAAYTLDYLGTLYQQMRRDADALKIYRRALAAFEKAQGAGGSEALSSAARLADAAESQAQWQEAEPLRRRLLDATAASEPQPAALAQALSDLALCLDAQKKWDEAMQLYGKALELRRRALGDQAPEVAETLSNQGRVWLMRGDAAKAEELLRQALAIDQAALEAGDPSLAEDWRRLASALKKAGKESEAGEALAKAAALDAERAAKARPKAKPQAKPKAAPADAAGSARP